MKKKKGGGKDFGISKNKKKEIKRKGRLFCYDEENNEKTMILEFEKHL